MFLVFLAKQRVATSGSADSLHNQSNDGYGVQHKAQKEAGLTAMEMYTETPGIKTPKKIMAEEPGRISYETDSDLYNLLWLWLTDKQGKNILRTPNDNERFPDFDLYKHIAKYANNCLPFNIIQNE